MKLKAGFSSNTVLPIKRRKSFSAIDFLSFFGGLLGLFAGFSVLSGAEVIYYFLVVPIMEMSKRNDSKVYPFEDFGVSDIGSPKLKMFSTFFKKLIQNSSIHGLNQIGGDQKGWIDR
jgi:hypothetical protein